jgi:hypothetical protein
VKLIAYSNSPAACCSYLMNDNSWLFKDPNRIDEVVEEAMSQDKPTIVNVYVDPNAAPLP